MNMPALPQPARSRARLPWALVPVALLLSSAVGVGSMAFVAARDPHFATEPDYYQKAIRWDRTQAQAATNQRLGYTLKLPAKLAADHLGQVTIELALGDRQGRPVSGAQLGARAFANAYSGEFVGMQFTEAAPGVYRALISVRHNGQWVFGITGSAGGEHFTAELRSDLVSGGAA